MTESEPVPELDPDRFGDFPVEPNDIWRIAAKYVGTSFIDLQTGVELEASQVVIQFASTSNMSVAASGCSGGSGKFQLVAGRVTNFEAAFDLIACTPTDVGTHAAAKELTQDDPEIRALDDRLLLLSARYRLELQTSDLGVIALIDEDERFFGVETSVHGIDPTRVVLTSPAFFVIHAQLPSCEMWGGSDPDDDVTKFQMEPSNVIDQCENSPEEDKAIQVYLDAGLNGDRVGDVIVATNDLGTITFQLANAEDPPQKKEPQIIPDRVIPPQPDRSEPPAGGKLSVPWYELRAGSSEPGGVDVPVPEDWNAADPSLPRVSVVGRGSLGVFDLLADELPFNPEAYSDRLELVEGPTAVTVKLYQLEDGQVVETGSTATVQQYRYGSSDPDEWVRQVTWVIERDGITTVATVGYPEFPEDSDFNNPEDSLQLSLTGLDPVDLLHDIRFFAS